MQFTTIPDHLRVRELYRSALFRASHVECRPGCFHCLCARQMQSHMFVFPRRGVWIKHRGRQTTVADPHHALMFNPDEPYRPSHPGGEGDDCDYLSVDPAAVLEAVREWDPHAADRPGRLLCFEATPTSARVALMQRRVFTRLQREAGGVSALAADESLAELIRAVLADAFEARGLRAGGARRGGGGGQHVSVRAQRDHIEVIKAILAQRFRENLSLDELSDLVELSPFYVCRIFHERTGISLHRYVMGLRLRAALDRLREPGLGLAELAAWLGYSSHSHFTEAFRREFGVTPSEARRTLRGTRREDDGEDAQIGERGRGGEHSRNGCATRVPATTAAAAMAAAHAIAPVLVPTRRTVAEPREPNSDEAGANLHATAGPRIHSISGDNGVGPAFPGPFAVSIGGGPIRTIR